MKPTAGLDLLNYTGRLMKRKCSGLHLAFNKQKNIKNLKSKVLRQNARVNLSGIKLLHTCLK
jgi:hypothetical protein